MSAVTDALTAEIQSKIKISMEYKQKRDVAKTKTKHKLYDKKLKRNNNEIYKLVNALQNLQDSKQSHE